MCESLVQIYDLAASVDAGSCCEFESIPVRTAKLLTDNPIVLTCSEKNCTEPLVRRGATTLRGSYVILR